MATSQPAPKTRAAQVSKARETEIARRLAQIFERLPLRALNSLLQNLIEGLNELTEVAKGSTTRRRWVDVPQKNGASVQISSPLAIAVEVSPQSEESLRRFDLVVPIPPLLYNRRLVTSLIFEFKLGVHNEEQLREYAGLAPNSLIISIATSGKSTETKTHLGVGQLIVLQSWEHLYFALQSMLSGDAQPRITSSAEPDDLLLNFEHRLAGQDRLAFEIESFLQLLILRSLLPNQDLVLIVPEGAYAKTTLTHSPPYYRHPASWRQGYAWLIAISRNEVVGIYRVLESSSTDLVNGILPPPPDSLSDKEWQAAASVAGSTVSVLEKLDKTHSRLGRFLGAKYDRKREGKTPAPFTMSHRYLENPEALVAYFY